MQDELPDWPRPVVHWEIEARDPAVVRAFYTALFNWRIDEGGRDSFILDIPAGVGGPEPGPAGHIRKSDRSGVNLYVQVRDLDASLAQAVELGGTVLMQPVHIPDGATIAGVADPEGNPLMLVQQ